MVKLGVAPSEFWGMTLPETVAMIGWHVKAQKSQGKPGKPHLSDEWKRETTEWLKGGGDDPGN